MKALSIKNPWALLIAHGIKDIENRTWRTKHRGKIYIHSSSRSQHGNIKGMFTEKQWKSLTWEEQWTVTGHWPNGSIIGEVDIVDCVLNHDSIWAEQMAYDVCPETGIHILRRNQKYVWNWVLANPVLYDRPIENVKGTLSLWVYR